MKKYTFKYRDVYSNGKWNEQVGICKSLKDLIAFYGLDRGDVEWQIIKIENA